MLKYGEVVLDPRSDAIVALRAQPMSSANIAFLKAFWPQFVEAMKIAGEIYGPLKEKIDAKDPETLADFNGFLSSETNLPLFPTDILSQQKSLSLNQYEIIESMQVKKPELNIVKD